jgi:hypothetical protein
MADGSRVCVEGSGRVCKWAVVAARVCVEGSGRLVSLTDPTGKQVDPTLYRSMIGSLLYLTAIRPNIAFSVGVCARFQENPKESHLTTVKRIIRYVNDALLHGIWYSRETNLVVAGYSDVDWAGMADDRKSTSRACFYVGTNLVALISRKQSSISLSTVEAEYIAAGSCCTLKNKDDF